MQNKRIYFLNWNDRTEYNPLNWDSCYTYRRFIMFFVFFVFLTEKQGIRGHVFRASGAVGPPQQSRYLFRADESHTPFATTWRRSRRSAACSGTGSGTAGPGFRCCSFSFCRMLFRRNTSPSLQGIALKEKKSMNRTDSQMKYILINVFQSKEVTLLHRLWVLFYLKYWEKPIPNSTSLFNSNTF